MAHRLTDQRHWDACYENLASSRPRTRRMRELARKLVLRKNHRLLRYLMHDVSQPEHVRVLELGVAPGVMLSQMHDVFPEFEYHGLDYSEVGLSKTRANLARRGITAALHHGDACSVTLPVQFDLVVSFGLVEHFDEPAEMIARHASFCKAGGKVVICVPDFSSPIPRRIHQFHDAENLAIHNLSIMSPVAMRQAFLDAGLENVETGSSGGPLLHPDAPGKAYGFIFRRLATAWNLGWHLSPIDFFWKSTVWGFGQRRDA